MGKVAVNVFVHDGRCLKVGKAGSKCRARYVSQHYNPDSAGSNLAKSLLGDASAFGEAPPERAAVGDWIRAHCDRIDFLLDAVRGMAVLTLLEAFIQCRLRPKYEGFKTSTPEQQSAPRDCEAVQNSHLKHIVITGSVAGALTATVLRTAPSSRRERVALVRHPGYQAA